MTQSGPAMLFSSWTGRTGEKMHWECSTAQAMVLVCSSWSCTFAALLNWL